MLNCGAKLFSVSFIFFNGFDVKFSVISKTIYINFNRIVIG